MEWLITNISNLVNSNNKLYYTNINHNFKDISGLSIYIDGYILPRTCVFKNYNNIPIEYIILDLYNKYEVELIHYIKGVFVLIIFNGDNFFIFNDRHSVKKYFIYQYNNIFIISNSLKLISKHCKLILDYENIAVFTLISHFINGATLFKNIYSCQPAEFIKFDSGKLKRSHYWSPENMLFNRLIKKMDSLSYAEKWKEIISEYICFLQPKDISLTLTGGNDSRMVLAGIYSLNKKCHTFTYGNPSSLDGILAQKISNELNLVHNNYFYYNANKEWFRKNALEIINFGNSLINIHRAHRNDAVKREVYHNPYTEMIFTGLVGGEYLKEPEYNDIIIPFLFQELYSKKKMYCLKILNNRLKEKGICTKEIDLEIVYDKFQNFLMHVNEMNRKEKKFIFTHMFYASVHHTQDPNVFGNYVKYIINPFMDIDFIEMIASYEKWYLNRMNCCFSKIFHSELFVKITDHLVPEISNIPYAKKDKYTANEILNFKLVYLFKKLYYCAKQERDMYPANFPMGSWLYSFCEEELEMLSSELKEIYDIHFLKKMLTNIRRKQTEESWHIVTNPINIHLNYEYFKKF